MPNLLLGEHGELAGVADEADDIFYNLVLLMDVFEMIHEDVELFPNVRAVILQPEYS